MFFVELYVKSHSVSPPIYLCFRPPYPLFQWYPQSEEIFIKSWYEMLKLSNLMLKIIESNYSSCTGGSSAGAQEKGHTG